MEPVPGIGPGVAGSTRSVIMTVDVRCRICLRPPGCHLAFFMRCTDARPALSRYTYCITVSATVVPMICARGCVPERCFIPARALSTRYRAGSADLASLRYKRLVAKHWKDFPTVCVSEPI
jgi:hypothetical protein